jgi:hypothetical protein
MLMGREGTAWAAALLVLVAGAGCDASRIIGPPAGTAPPESFDAFYYDRAVHLSWDLHAGWAGEPFRVYAKRGTDPDFFLIAEITNCAAGRCSYTDVNIVAGVTYEYFVAAVDPDTGEEAATPFVIEVFVPNPDPPPVPGGLDGIALDGAVFLLWDARSRNAEDFGFYRVYMEDGAGTVFLLGETDSEGFLDLLVENGSTYGYFVTAVDTQGHESEGSALVEATPRPDFHGELLYAFEDRLALSGFRFRESETLDPIVSGTSPDRHFRLEVDDAGWWLVPGPGVQVHAEPVFTTALRCGPAADAGCIDVRVAPSSNYTTADVALVPEFAYVIRVPAGGGQWRYGLIRVTHVGSAQDGAVALFDWAFQLQADNRSLMPGGVEVPGSS